MNAKIIYLALSSNLFRMFLNKNFIHKDLPQENMESHQNMYVLQNTKRYIEQHHLFNQEDKILIGLSGGADSVALLFILKELGYKCIAAHCNFHLRGEESNRDEVFVVRLCNRLGIKLYKTQFNTSRYAAKNKISIEMAARELRYGWFNQIKKEAGAQWIAVAHHQDDQVETILINLTRGTGITGLQGMRPKREDIVRPLLALSKKDILDYLDTIQEGYVTDSTNLEADYTRNFLRLHILPLLEKINPSVKKTIAKTGEYLSEVNKIYSSSIEQSKKRVCTEKGKIAIEKLVAELSPKTILHELISPYGFNSSQVDEVYQSLGSQSGKIFHTESFSLLKDREYLLIKKNKSEHLNTFPFLLKISQVKVDKNFKITPNPAIAYLDIDKVGFPVSYRKWQEGDSFRPLGMKGTKKISDYLIDAKKSLFEKEKQYVLCSSDNKIVWLIGERIDDRYKITATTKEVLIVTKEEKF